MLKLSEAQKRALCMMLRYQCFAVRSIQRARARCYYLPAKRGAMTPYEMWRTSLHNATLSSLQRHDFVERINVGGRTPRDTTFYLLTAKGRKVAKELEEQAATH